MVRFHFLTGDVNWLEYDGKWISNKQNNGEFDFWYVLEFINWENNVGEREAKDIGSKYHVTIYVVSPSEAGPANIKAAQDCCGVDDDMLAQAGEEWLVEILQSYGVATPIWQQDGSNAKSLLMKAKRYCNQEASMMFGLLMDRPVNRIGSTGWEFLSGDINSAIARATGTAGDIMRKMSGVATD